MHLVNLGLQQIAFQLSMMCQLLRIQFPNLFHKYILKLSIYSLFCQFSQKITKIYLLCFSYWNITTSNTSIERFAFAKRFLSRKPVDVKLRHVSLVFQRPIDSNAAYWVGLVGIHGLVKLSTYTSYLIGPLGCKRFHLQWPGIRLVYFLYVYFVVY